MNIVSPKPPIQTKIYRKDYQPPPCQIPKITLDITLNGAETIIEGTLEIIMNAGQTSVTLNGEAFKTLSLTLDGAPLQPDQYRMEEELLHLENLPPKAIFGAKVQLDPASNLQLSGLYRSSDLYCTQCEAEGFRRIFWSLDRPDSLSRFNVTLRAKYEEAPVLLSNGNLIASKPLADGWHEAVFDDPFNKPTYLFALVAGKLEAVKTTHITPSKREVELAVWVAPGKADYAHHALESLRKSMIWDENYYGLEYDLDQFNIVAVDDFNFGAMENKSLNIFNAAYVLADPVLATDGDYHNVESIVAHEYFHNWTGNRVTCRDWFQLSLKEGLTVFRDQSFSETLHRYEVERIQQVNGLRSFQFPEDSGPLAHPVRPEAYEEINNFYTATIYEKGAEVIRMLHTLLGEEGYQKGIKLYFERHDGSAATCDEFIDAMADANAMELEQFRLWYGQIGTPTLEIDWQYEPTQDRVYLSVKQQIPYIPPPAQALMIPLKMALLDKTGKPIPCDWREQTQESWQNSKDGELLLTLTKSQSNFEFKEVKGFHLPSLNRGFSAPVHIKTNGQDRDLRFLAIHDQDALNRYDALYALAKSAILSTQPLEEAAKDYLDAFKATLEDDQLAPELKVELLGLPGEAQLWDGLDQVMVETLHQRRHALIKSLCTKNYDSLAAQFKHYCDPHYKTDEGAPARRRMTNWALGLIAANPDEHTQSLIWQHYKQADNMTNRIAALNGLLYSGGSEHVQEALDDFADRFKDFPTALDKWFALQSSNRHYNLEKIIALQEHALFNQTNPNRLRALYGGFARNNLINFHNPDGNSYRFMGEVIAKLDQQNPMIAARLVTCFGQWRKLDEQRQKLIIEQLRTLAARPNLSKDSRELVNKTLGEKAN